MRSTGNGYSTPTGKGYSTPIGNIQPSGNVQPSKQSHTTNYRDSQNDTKVGGESGTGDGLRPQA